MAQQTEYRAKWRSNYIGANFRTVYDVHGVTNGGRQDLGFVAVVVVDGAYFVYKRQSVRGNVVQPAQERGNVSRTCFSCQQRLSGRKYKRTVGFYAFV